MSKETCYLNNVDPEDIGDVLVKIERSFNIRLNDEMLKEVNTFGSLCDVITQQIDQCHSESCTTQHAFYQLRNAITAATGIDKCSIKPQTKVCEIFPRENRLQIIAEIENELGLDVSLLRPRQWIITLFTLMLIASVAVCFYNWKIGALGAVVFIVSLKLAGKFGKEIHVKTIGDLANKISREQYLKVRRNSGTINKREIEQKVRELFITDLHLEPVVLRRDSRFN